MTQHQGGRAMRDFVHADGEGLRIRCGRCNVDMAFRGSTLSVAEFVDALRSHSAKCVPDSLTRRLEGAAR